MNESNTESEIKDYIQSGQPIPLNTFESRQAVVSADLPVATELEVMFVVLQYPDTRLRYVTAVDATQVLTSHQIERALPAVNTPEALATMTEVHQVLKAAYAKIAIDEIVPFPFFKTTSVAVGSYFVQS